MVQESWEEREGEGEGVVGLGSAGLGGAGLDEGATKLTAPQRSPDCEIWLGRAQRLHGKPGGSFSRWELRREGKRSEEEGVVGKQVSVAVSKRERERLT